MLDCALECFLCMCVCVCVVSMRLMIFARSLNTIPQKTGIQNQTYTRNKFIYIHIYIIHALHAAKHIHIHRTYLGHMRGENIDALLLSSSREFLLGALFFRHQSLGEGHHSVCALMYVCVCVCMCAYVDVCMRMLRYVCVCLCMCVCIC